MAQTSIIEIVNQPLKTIRTDMNLMAKAGITLNAGSIAPVPSPSGSNPKSMPWIIWNDTDTKTIKIRNADDDDWIVWFDYSNMTTIPFKPFKKVTKDITITSTGQTDFSVGEEYVAESLSVFRNGVKIIQAYVTESDQSTDPGEFSLDSTYIGANNFNLTYEVMSVEYFKYI
jgi:hypothetical protein